MTGDSIVQLAGKVAIVTGAAQGLGAVFARALARQGARVVVTDVSPTESAVDSILAAGGDAMGMAIDVTSQASVAAVVAGVLERWGQIDILVNNAAISGKLELQPLVEISTADWDRVLAVNTRGPFECMKAVIPTMQVAKTGSIVNIASGTAIKGSPGLLHYVASKGAVIAMTRAAARELGSQGTGEPGNSRQLYRTRPHHE